jgi:hypothetical protein
MDRQRCSIRDLTSVLQPLNTDAVIGKVNYDVNSVYKMYFDASVVGYCERGNEDSGFIKGG